MARAMFQHSILVAACLMAAACGQASQEQPSAEAQAPEVAASMAPANVGECVETIVALVGPRLEGAPDSGSAIQYANGLGQVSYDIVPGIANSQVGDAVNLCLVSVPENCPPGDDRGRVYAATNARTGETWSAPGSQHMCGGA
jgi:hypothetical protein